MKILKYITLFSIFPHLLLAKNADECILIAEGANKMLQDKKVILQHWLSFICNENVSEIIDDKSILEKDLKAYCNKNKCSKNLIKLFSLCETHNKAIDDLSNGLSKHLMSKYSFTVNLIEEKKDRKCDSKEFQSLLSERSKNIKIVLEGKDEYYEKTLNNIYQGLKKLSLIESQYPIVLSAQNYIEDYSNNGVYADSKYKDKLLKISGYAREIENNTFGNGATIHLHPELSKYGFKYILIDIQDAKTLLKIKKDQHITVIGQGNSTTLGTPTLKNSQIYEN